MPGVVLTAMTLGGCVVAGTPGADPYATSAVSSVRYPEIRQTDDLGRTLPFKTVFAHRWSDNNDRTTYEPCTAVTSGVLESLDLDPNSVRDAAAVDYQTVRGCRWKFHDGPYTFLAQHVGNMNTGVTNVAQYKANFRDFRWFPGLRISGREVGVMSIGVDNCGTITASGGAFVFTQVGIGSDTLEVSENCRRAIAFTRATIDQIPK